MNQELQPTALQADQQGLRITWSDSVTHHLPWTFLRERCPCASCRVKRSEPPKLLQVLKAEETAPLRAIGIQPVGNYAYHIDFSDGHNTGIFALDVLRALGEELASRRP